MKTIYPFILIILFPISIFTQSIENIKNDNLFVFKWSNDFWYQTDEYYSNGFTFEFYNPVFKYNPFNFILLPNARESNSLEGITLTQDFYTPTELTDTVKQKADRPFAAYLLLGFKRISINKKHDLKLTSEIQFGIVGESAMGEEIQNGIHDLLPTSSFVYGWANQIRDDFCFNYTVGIEKQIWQTDWAEINLLGFAKIGTPFTQFDIGLNSRIGKFDKKYFAGFEHLSNDNWQLFFNADFRSRFILFNATLQGGLFNNNSVYTIDNPKPVVGDFLLGITFVYKTFRIEYAQSYLTPEIPNGKIHKWGTLNIRFGF